MSSPQLLKPINTEKRYQVVAATEQYIELAAGLFGREFAPIPVLFDLSGRASGMYRVNGKARQIRYNPYIFARYFEDHLVATVAHEVAHYIADCLYGMANIKPHGVEWRAVMGSFGVEASRTFDHSLDGVPQRRYQRVAYRCDCGAHQLGIRRHNKVRRRQAVYRCRRCQAVLVAMPTDSAVQE